MSAEFPYDVFLSHSAKDKAVVRPLPVAVARQSAALFSAWQVQEEEAGGALPRHRHAEQPAVGFRIADFGFAQPGMSVHAFGSDWASLEAGTFRFRDPLNQEQRFIPLRLDDAPIQGSPAQFLDAMRHFKPTSRPSTEPKSALDRKLPLSSNPVELYE